MFSLSSNFSDFGHTSPPAGHLLDAVDLLRPVIFGRHPALLPKHFEIQGLKGCRRHFQHHPAAVAHDLGGNIKGFRFNIKIVIAVIVPPSTSPAGTGESNI